MFPLLSPPARLLVVSLSLSSFRLNHAAHASEPEPTRDSVHAAGRTFPSFRVALPPRQEEITFARVLSTATVEVDSLSNLSRRGRAAGTFNNR